MLGIGRRPPTLRQRRRGVSFAVRLAWRADRRRLRRLVGHQLLTAALTLTLVLAASRGVRATVGGAGLGGTGLLIVFGVAAATTTGMLILRIVGEPLRRELMQVIAASATGEVLDAAVHADLRTFEEPEFHDRIQRALAAASQAAPQVLSALLSVGLALLNALAVATAFATLLWWLAPLVLVALVPMMRANRAGNWLNYRTTYHLAGTDRMRLYLEDLLIGRAHAAEVRAFGLDVPLRGRWDACITEKLARTVDMNRTYRRQHIVAALVSHLIIGLIFGAVALLVAGGTLDAVIAGTVCVAVWVLSSQLRGLGLGLAGVAQATYQVLDLREVTTATHREPAAPARRFHGLTVDGVTFRYPGQRHPALDDVSIQLAEGEIVALVGPNGSGKTTLAKLLAGLYSPDTGAIAFDDPEPTLAADLRATATVVFQDFGRYRFSAADNIAFGRTDRPPDLGTIRHAARMADADALIEDLPDGYDTPLTREFGAGVDLSIGQWQRIAIARAFYRDSALVILDEPTASLDAEAEADLFARIRELFTGRTVLLISHRFSSVRHADRIYVLGSGRIVENGTHHTLLAADGHYARMFRTQAAAYLDVRT